MHTTPEVSDQKSEVSSASPVSQPTPDLRPPTSGLVHRRGLNASLETIRQGLQPIAQVEAVCQTYNCARSGRKYFLFRNGQLRRQIGEGHSKFERATRRLDQRVDYATRRLYKKARAAEQNTASPART